MSTMGKYCKAYPVDRLREFKAWRENAQNIKRELRQVNGKEEQVERELTDSDYLYVQENFTVTDGIFLDENTIFDNVSNEWVEFCRNNLGFKVPEHEVTTSSQGSGPVAENGSDGLSKSEPTKVAV
jgi:hypothetical protein